LGKNIIDRCNLVVLFEKGQEDLASFLADNKVDIIASLPCYTEGNTDKQRGRDVFKDRCVPNLFTFGSCYSINAIYQYLRAPTP